MNTNSYLCYTSQTRVLCAISRCTRPRYNGTWLYLEQTMSNIHFSHLFSMLYFFMLSYCSLCAGLKVEYLLSNEYICYIWRWIWCNYRVGLEWVFSLYVGLKLTYFFSVCAKWAYGLLVKLEWAYLMWLGTNACPLMLQNYTYCIHDIISLVSY